MPLSISGVDLIDGVDDGAPGAGAGPSPPTIALVADVFSRYTHASVRFFTLLVVICFSVLKRRPE